MTEGIVLTKTVHDYISHEIKGVVDRDIASCSPYSSTNTVFL